MRYTRLYRSIIIIKKYIQTCQWHNCFDGSKVERRRGLSAMSLGRTIEKQPSYLIRHCFEISTYPLWLLGTFLHVLDLAFNCYVKKFHWRFVELIWSELVNKPSSISKRKANSTEVTSSHSRFKSRVGALKVSSQYLQTPFVYCLYRIYIMYNLWGNT